MPPYFRMFCEGLYLHTVLVVAFVKSELLMKLFYVIGWGFPIIPAVSYGIVRALDDQEKLENQKCWINPGPYLYILAAPVIISLLVSHIPLVPSSPLLRAWRAPYGRKRPLCRYTVLRFHNSIKI